MITLITAILVTMIGINSKAEEISYYDIPIEYRMVAEDVEDICGISKYFLLAIAYQESRFDSKLTNGNITQITNLKWFAHGIESTGVDNPKTDCKDNMLVCGWYCYCWLEQHEDYYLVARLWNEGDSALRNPNYISGYSRSVVNRMNRWMLEDMDYEEKNFPCRNPNSIKEREDSLNG